jgi:Uma2 family endonuclease
MALYEPESSTVPRIRWKPEGALMATVLTSPPGVQTLADFLEQLGNIPLSRIRVRAPLGTATEQDVLDIYARDKRLCELVDGVLVEKAMGFEECCLATMLILFLQGFVRPRNLGLVTAPDGLVRLSSGLVRIPDVAFFSWDHIPGRRRPKKPIPDLCPDLAVEILSTSNTAAEMLRKRREYFEAGARLVWLIDPANRTVEVYTSPDQRTLLDESQTLDGGDVLPGFVLPLRELFAELDRDGNS